MEAGVDTTPTTLVARVREVDAVRRAADLELLQLAAAWADAHPDLSAADAATSVATGAVDPMTIGGLGEEVVDFDDWRGIPTVAWDAAAGLATALGRSTPAADRLIRQALTLRHRLPRLWGRVLDGSVESFRARRVADAVVGRPDDVCADVDAHVARVVDTVGITTLDRLVEEAMLRLHPEEVELERLAQLDARFVKIDELSINHTGVADLTARAEWADLAAFDEAVSAVAKALAQQDAAADLPADTLDVRRSRALGVLADPASALALLEAGPAPSPRRRTQLVLHLTLDAMARHGLLGRDGRLDRPLLGQAVRDWCGRRDTHLTVTPVHDLEEHVQVGAYEIEGRMRERVELAHPTCVFPWCALPARRCDVDHRVAWGDDGASCDYNLAPLCRRHHRLKTHRGYRYTLIEPGTWLWRTPHGLQLLRDRHGSHDVTPDQPPAGRPGASCLVASPGRPTAARPRAGPPAR
ncbi:HNH endonuclease signature motif containing protein [Nocardioides coralli]|uniref:HNH endonuclease signature motif containing protein n=1 Tax=Nocardioides coralli TaxID=2872154 RepID=UPI001CA46CBD|nr:HNH endonuclease signature motif containing protein [Nocardioides coralli]QZY30111.1 HNH endonuclease [Nocardioides coralli]